MMPIVPARTRSETTPYRISEFDLANQKAQPIANVVRGCPLSRTVVITIRRTEQIAGASESMSSSRRVRHLHFLARMAASRHRPAMHRIVSRPVFDSERWAWCAPMTRMALTGSRAEIDHDPLRMGVFVRW
jgi:hypothetical protein